MSDSSPDAPIDGPTEAEIGRGHGSSAQPGRGRPGRALRDRSQRARVLWIGSVVSAILIVLGVAIPVPFVALGPGSTFNTIADGQGGQVITFAGSDVPAVASEQPDGHLNMLTIRIVDHIPLIEAASMWVSGDYEFAPRSEFYPPDKSKDEVLHANVQVFRESQSIAAIEALRYLGYPERAYVANVTEGSPSAGVLQPNDRIIAIDDHRITDYQSLKAVMATTHPGQQVEVTVQRDDSPVTVSITLGAQDAQGPQGFLGIGVVERPYAPFTIDISLEEIGGPSAGLMFTLGIIDRLTPGSLSGGKFIAGTGTIHLDGDVGPIGGVTLKEVAARSAGAEVMLVPAQNCAEALTAVPDGLTLVKVTTLADALSAVRAIAAGQSPARCELP